MCEIEVTVHYKKGIHARPAAEIVQTAGKFNSKIFIGFNENESVNAKSIIGVLTLGATHGSTLVVTANGPDEEMAIAALRELFGKNK